jgi:hypothetical protein
MIGFSRIRQPIAKAKYFGKFTATYRADAINQHVATMSHFMAYMHNMR